MINGLQWSWAANTGGGGGPVCPASPFDPATLSLSVWFEGRDCPATATPWPGRTSGGTSGALSLDQYFGSAGPQGFPHATGVAPCGLDGAKFRASPYAVSGFAYGGGGTDVIPGTDGTVVAAFKYVLGRTSGVAPQYDSAIVEAFHDQWRVQMNGSGQAQVSCTTSSGVQVATTSNSVVSGDWCFVVAKFSGSSVSVQLNGGTVASFASARTPVSQNLILVGFQGTFGEILDMDLSCLWIANSVLSAGDVADLKTRADWYVGTTI